jgi:hypothetical protein
LVVELGVVVVVTAVEATPDEEAPEELPVVVGVPCCDALDDVERLPDVVGVVELTVAPAEAVVAGICLETTSPSTAATAAARTATAFEARRALVRAMSRRRIPSCCARPEGPAVGSIGGPNGGYGVDELLMQACHHLNLATRAQSAMSRL